MDNNTYFTGSICVSDIPKELIKEVMCKDGKVRKYLNIAIMPKKKPSSFTNDKGTVTFTHYITCAPPRAEQVEGKNYFIGDLQTKQFPNNGSANTQSAPASGYSSPSPSPFGAAPAEQDEDLPF